MQGTPTDALDATKDAVIGVFSWAILSAVGIIISGKLLAKRVPLGIVEDDFFRINLLVFRMKATGDEVSLGFIMFILTLVSTIVFGGQHAYLAFKAHSGIDIGQWNSLCAISSFASIAVSTIFWVLAGLALGAPILAASERQRMLDQLKDDQNG